MSRTIYFTALSLDGYVADADGSLDWLFAVPRDEESGTGSFSAFFSRIGALCMGATTYDWVLAEGSLTTDPARWQAYYGDRPCWVFAHRPRMRLPGADIRFVDASVETVHPEIVAAAGRRDVWMMGGGVLAGQYFDAGLIDELHLHVAPVFLGGGAPALPRFVAADRLRLREAREDGAFVSLRYDVLADARRAAPR